MEKRKKKNIQEKTQAQLDKEQNVKNIILVCLLIIALGASIAIGTQLKNEILSYNESLVGYKDINDQVGDIKPLYNDEKKEEINYDVNFKFENTDLYLELTDKIYKNLKPYHDEYKNIYSNFDKDNIDYIEIYLLYDNYEKYFYLTKENLYVSTEQTKKINSLEIFDNKQIDLLFELISSDIPKDFSNYIDYIVAKQYYEIETNIKFNITGKIFLNNGEEKILSLSNFIRYIEILKK